MNNCTIQDHVKSFVTNLDDDGLLEAIRSSSELVDREKMMGFDTSGSKSLYDSLLVEKTSRGMN